MIICISFKSLLSHQNESPLDSTRHFFFERERDRDRQRERQTERAFGQPHFPSPNFEEYIFLFEKY